MANQVKWHRGNDRGDKPKSVICTQGDRDTQTERDRERQRRKSVSRTEKDRVNWSIQREREEREEEERKKRGEAGRQGGREGCVSGFSGFGTISAGGISASVSHGGTVPIDVVKTRLQTDPSMRNSNFIVGTKTIIRNEGAQTLLGGLGSTLIGYAIQGSLKYGFYELFKPIVLASENVLKMLRPWKLLEGEGKRRKG
eukprot:767445-Hanusia_phi.AAC.1